MTRKFWQNPLVRFVYAIWFLCIFAIGTVFGCFLTLLFGLFSDRGARYVTNTLWSKMTMFAAGVRLESLGLDNIPSSKDGFIVYANHTSALDIPALALGTGLSVTWVAKASLGKIPFFGWGLARAHMLVNRAGGPAETKEMVQEAISRLKGGQILSIFPEGTRNRSEAPLLPFKKGTFLLAKHTGALLVPVALKNAKDLWPAGAVVPMPGTIRCKVGEPLAPIEGENLGALATRAQAHLAALLEDESW